MKGALGLNRSAAEPQQIEKVRTTCGSMWVGHDIGGDPHAPRIVTLLLFATESRRMSKTYVCCRTDTTPLHSYPLS
jgi:hypothetical protein